MEVRAEDRVYEFVGHAPRGPLSRVVASVVGYRTADPAPSLHRGAPSPYLTFIVNLDTPIVTGTHSGAERDGTTQAYDNILAGLHTRPAYLFQPEHQAGIQLAVHPLAARRLFGVPARELATLADEAGDVLGARLRTVRDRAAEAPSWQDRFQVVAEYLLGRADAYAPRRAPRREVVEAWRWMTVRGGTGRMDDLARHVAMSPRQLATLFNDEVGVPPKVVNRLVRFDTARHEIARRVRTGEGAPLSEVAYAVGYYDQAHLAREFREMLGCSASAWVAEELANIQAGGPTGGADSSP